MKYRTICTYTESCTFGMACSKCGGEVGYDDVFCRKCGHKLRVLPRQLDTKMVLAILTQAISGAEVVEQEVSGVVITGPNNDDTSTSVEERCPMRRSKKCDQCDPDGICHAVVYPTMPPKHQYCPYSGKTGYTN